MLPSIVIMCMCVCVRTCVHVCVHRYYGPDTGLTDRRRSTSSVVPNLVSAPEIIRTTELKFAFNTFSGTLHNVQCV